MKDDSDIPDLLPPGRGRVERAAPREEKVAIKVKVERPAGSGDAGPAIAVPADADPADPADLEFDLAGARGDELPWDSPFRPSEAPDLDEPELRVPVRAQSVRPPAAVSASVRPAPPMLDLGLDSTVWDLDDDLNDPAAAQLNVAIPMKAKDEVPWPICRTPQPESLDIDPDAVLRVLDLPAPGGWLAAPFYYWAARSALRRLTGATATAENALLEAEGVRDRLLGDLALAARPTLEGTDRFRASYDRFEQNERVVEDAKAALGRADVKGETGLSQIDVELTTASGTVGLHTRHAAERRALASGGERELARLRAALQRLSIERRNIITRAQETSAPGAEMPPELAGRFLAVEDQIKRGEAELTAAQAAQKEFDAQLRVAEQEEMRALSEVRRIEAKREGLILSQQGTLGDLNESLEGAEAALTKVRADVGLAIVELHGEIPIDEATRRQLLTADAAVSACALDLELSRRAGESVDTAAVQRGRAVLVALGIVVLGLLAWLLVR